MGVPLIDLTFLEKSKYLWDREMVGKMEYIFEAFLESRNDQGMEQCFLIFCNKFSDAKVKFINAIQELPLIMKCRTKADSASQFGGAQCASFMSDLIFIIDEYFSTTAYASDTSELSIPSILQKLKSRAQNDKVFAQNFEIQTATNYQRTGTDNSAMIVQQSGWAFDQNSNKFGWGFDSSPDPNKSEWSFGVNPNKSRLSPFDSPRRAGWDMFR